MLRCVGSKADELVQRIHRCAAADHSFGADGRITYASVSQTFRSVTHCITCGAGAGGTVQFIPGPGLSRFIGAADPGQTNSDQQRPGRTGGDDVQRRRVGAHSLIRDGSEPVDPTEDAGESVTRPSERSNLCLNPVTTPASSDSMSQRTARGRDESEALFGSVTGRSVHAVIVV